MASQRRYKEAEVERRRGAEGAAMRPTPSEIPTDGRHAPAGGAIAHEFRSLAAAQPALAQLIVDETETLGRRATAVGIRTGYLVWRVFEDGALDLEAVDAGEVRTAFDRTTLLLYNLGDADEQLAARALSHQQSGHPELMSIVEETLLSYEQAGTPLTNGELGVLFALSRTCIDILHGAAVRAAHG